MAEHTTTLDQADQLARRISGSLVSSVSAAEIGTLSKLPWKLVSARELLLHRLSSLSASAVDCYRRRESVAAVLLTRALLETTAMLYSLAAALEACVAAKSVAGVDKALMNVLFGSRNEMTSEVATNILSRIDKVDAHFKGYRWWYDHLSEVAHPNYSGLFDAYGMLDTASATLRLGPNPSMGEFGEKMGIPALCSALEIAIHVYDEMPQHFPVFVSLCEAEISAGDA